MMLSTSLQKPMYVQIEESLADLIRSGKLPPDSKIKSEREISEDLGVSRMTVRRALTELVDECLVVRKRGSGTYVAKPKITYEFQELIDHLCAMHERNVDTANQVLQFGELAAGRRLAERLAVDIGHPLYHVVVLRFANRIPVILEKSYISCSECPQLEEGALEESSMIDLLVRGYKVNIDRVIQTIEATTADRDIAQRLRIDEGFSLLRLSRTFYTGKEEKPILYSQDFLRSDCVRIRTDSRL
jgi:GntR family transcriptional regulator